MGFPSSSSVKESACNAGDPNLIPGSGRSPGEGISYSLQYSWASLVPQTIKNLPAMRETWVFSLSWEDPWEKVMAIHSRRTSQTEEPGGLQSLESQRVGHDLVTKLSTTRKKLSWSPKQAAQPHPTPAGGGKTSLLPSNKPSQ